MDLRNAEFYMYLIEFVLLLVSATLGVLVWIYKRRIRQAKEMAETMRSFEIALENAEDDYRHVVHKILIYLGKIRKEQKVNGELDKLFEELEAAYIKWKEAKEKRQNKHWEFYIVSNRYGVNRRM